MESSVPAASRRRLDGSLARTARPVAAIAGRNPGRTALAALFIGGRATPVTIEELPALSSYVLIAVSDRGVEPVAEILAKSGLRCGVALHTCDAKGPQALAVPESQGVSCGALHPIQSFASAEQGVASVVGSSFGIDGNPEALRWASSIVALMGGGRSLRISPQHRGLYHAAAVMAGSYIAALIYAVAMLVAAGVERSTALMALAPLVRTSGENSLDLGPVEALTGPIERGDNATVLAHLEDLRSLPDPVRRLYCSAGELVVQMASLRGLQDAKAAKIQEMLRTAQ